MATVDEIVVDSARAPLLAQFWAAALDGYEVRAYDDAEIRRLASLGLAPETDPIVMVDGPGPTFCFQEVSERKRAKNACTWTSLRSIAGPRSTAWNGLARPCPKSSTIAGSCSTQRATNTAFATLYSRCSTHRLAARTRRPQIVGDRIRSSAFSDAVEPAFSDGRARDYRPDSRMPLTGISSAWAGRYEGGELRSGLTCRLYSGPHGVSANRSDSDIGSVSLSSLM